MLSICVCIFLSNSNLSCTPLYVIDYSLSSELTQIAVKSFEPKARKSIRLNLPVKEVEERVRIRNVKGAQKGS